MTFNDEQLAALKPYEGNFATAINAKWSRGLGTAALKTIHGIYNEATGKVTRLYISCGQCCLKLLQDVGRIYFDDLKERDRQILLKQEEAICFKTEVKTEKPKRTRKKANAV